MSLSVNDIRVMLGESTYSLKNLSLSTKINMWSKIKPYNKDYTYGYSYSYYSTAANALAAAKTLGNGGLAWTYQRPTGNYNVGSFVGYNHGAGHPFYYRPSQTEFYTGDEASIIIGSAVNSDYELTDFFSSDYKVECALKHPDNSGTIVTTNGVIKASNLLKTGTYDCAVIITNGGNKVYLTPYPYFTITRMSGSPVALVSCDILGKTASNVVMRGIGKARTITNIQAVWRTKMTSNAWATAGTGEGDGGTIIDTYDVYPEGTLIKQGNLGVLFSVTGSNLSSTGYLFLRFRYNGYQQQVLLAAGGATPVDPPTA